MYLFIAFTSNYFSEFLERNLTKKEPDVKKLYIYNFSELNFSESEIYFRFSL